MQPVFDSRRQSVQEVFERNLILQILIKKNVVIFPQKYNVPLFYSISLDPSSFK